MIRDEVKDYTGEGGREQFEKDRQEAHARLVAMDDDELAYRLQIMAHYVEEAIRRLRRDGR